MSRDVSMPLAIDEIVIQDGRREIDPAVVKRLADSIENVGLRHPITVRRKGEQYILVAGRHRIEACRKLGREHVPATIVSMTNAEARMWEIAENLHRAELTKLDRSNQIAEWVKLCEQQRVSAQVARKPGRPEGGMEAASRDLGIERTDVQRAVKIAGITDEAQEAATAAGIDDNQSKLLEVARSAPADQVDKVAEIASRKRIEIPEPKDWSEVEAAQKRSLMLAWNSSSPSVQAWFRENITDRPAMDRRFG